jgi:23S rRNA G2445 N2-methylase RlmL
MRRHQNKLQGWEVLTRLSPRPLATRPWRVADMPGALNATIAAAMVDLSQPRPSDRFLNLMCGSGTLLIERGLAGPAQSLMGLDHNLPALQAAQRNVEAAGLTSHIQLRQAEVNAPTLPPGQADVICADLPWGSLVGSHDENLVLYPAFFQSITRLAAPQARLILLSHEIRLIEDLFHAFRLEWQMQERLKITQSGWHPRLYVAQFRQD